MPRETLWNLMFASLIQSLRIVASFFAGHSWLSLGSAMTSLVTSAPDTLA